MLSALVLLPVTLLCVWVGGYAFLLLVAVAGLVLAYEWLGMCGHTSSDSVFFWFPTAIVAVSAGAGLGHAGAGLVVVVIGTVAAAIWGAHYSDTRPGPVRPGSLVRNDVAADVPVEPGVVGFDGAGHAGTGDVGHAGTDDAAHAGSVGTDHAAWAAWPIPPKCDLALGFAWLSLPAVALLWLRADPVAGLPNTLFILAIVWSSDIGAYMLGRLVGGPKLARAISPGKTWSGAIGGLASAVLAGIAVAACFSPEISSSHVIGPGIVLGIISQAGDLLESALKRHFGVKDSGHIIPGHGGLLDRLDALLAVAPIAALLAFTVGRGVVLWR